MTIKNSTVGNVYGGEVTSGNATGNKVIIEGDDTVVHNTAEKPTKQPQVVGGWADSGNGNATGNTVTISGGTFSDIDSLL